MKKLRFGFPILLLVVVPGWVFCSEDPMLHDGEAVTVVPADDNDDETDLTSELMNIKIADRTFSVALADNETAAAFRSILPMTVVMNDLNSNEKYCNLSSELPVNARRPGTIRAGDLMLFGSDCIVLFYKSFSTSYSYTSIGRIADVTGLSEALGGGRVTVTFERPEE